jgi:hypothetical protein
MELVLKEKDQKQEEKKEIVNKIKFQKINKKEAIICQEEIEQDQTDKAQ